MTRFLCKTILVLNLFSLMSCKSIEYFKVANAEDLHQVTVRPDIRITETPFELKPKIRKAAEGEHIESTCALSSMPGNLLGAFEARFFNVFRITNNKATIALAPAVFNERLVISKLVEPGADYKIDLNISPRDTKFSRIATVCEERVSLFVGENGETLSLVYFDRPSSIQGRIENAKYKMQINLKIPKKGFYFLKETRNSDGVSVFDQLYAGQDVFFAVSPLEQH